MPRAGFGEKAEKPEEAYDINHYHQAEIRRILRKAFEIARTRKKRVLSVDKANVLATSRLWRRLAEETAQEFPDCQLTHQYVDSAAMKIIQNPKDFDVIVTENLFGDILSDEASVLPGSLGVLPSASHGAEGVSLYEPIHGSAPDIKGQNKANPTALLLSAVEMLKYLKFNKHAENIEKALFKTLKSDIKTADIGGSATCTEFTEEIIKNLEKE